MVQVRQARLEDEAVLREIDAATWAEDVTPAPPRRPDAAFFHERTRPAETLVAEIDGVAVGYALVGQALPLASHAHVLELRGLAVDPARQRRGAGRRLVEASVEQARGRGARKLALRVLGSNVRARRLYESCGFLVEGVLQAEFFLGGRYVDDVLMARNLIADQPSRTPEASSSLEPADDQDRAAQEPRRAASVSCADRALPRRSREG